MGSRTFTNVHKRFMGSRTFTNFMGSRTFTNFMGSRTFTNFLRYGPFELKDCRVYNCRLFEGLVYNETNDYMKT